ncbi:[protein-PII] uridylyltransferase [Allocatelliglobosispora scoriae]|uniref:Bifunctional uridylyltransferase/uridylyl-removing enzyme n=1 Tax=Allocatelliglobosispora scoriae TaxID=643052 RepID=A0A841BZ77_9ACTN|nr:[protein-PII] uridylyltransferase [Allocatelliglobosispora scoriae]MBB5872213.1 [protein-PII] uridylyltransferase [Allocatelliglobosispora scoriae]
MPTGIGPVARELRATWLDSWLRGVVDTATEGAGLPKGVALVAVGGLGRRECSPHSDVDLILLHSGVFGIDELASKLWYPIWDSRRGLDHSVRTIAETLSAAHDDSKVALGLVDLRHLCGDPSLLATLQPAALDLWRRTAVMQLSRLRELTEARYVQHGELAHLLEGDLKEAAGGLRDVGVLRGIGRAGIADALPPAVRAAQTRILDVRDALHLSAGRKLDRLVAHERAIVAKALGLADGDALLRRVATDAATIAWTLQDAWRSVHRFRADLRRGGAVRKPERLPLAADVVEFDGEVVLARSAVTPRPDPALSLRVAAAAAHARLPIARATLEWLSSHVPALPVPWPDGARTALMSLLGSGSGLTPTWTACDRFGLVTTWLPEWGRLRGAPQHNPVHRFTLDQHLVAAAAEAGKSLRDVARPDLLLLGALVHDVGKGLPGDHSTVGRPIAAAIAARVGLPADDVATIEFLVRHHLLLPDVATRRDLSDPATIATVVDAVGTVERLELLHALAKADAVATGPAAWSPWKASLIDELFTTTRSVMKGSPLPAPPAPDPALLIGELPVVICDESRVSIAAADRTGLFASVAGSLATHRLDVMAADSVTIDGRALLHWVVAPRFGGEVDFVALRADLRRAALGQLPPPSHRVVRSVPGAGEPALMWHEGATDAVILELRTVDAPGLLYRVTSALADAGVDVRAARVSTLGSSVVDAFYLPPDVDRAAAESVVRAAFPTS